MANLEGLGIRFAESMSGYLGLAEEDPRRGEAIGKQSETPISFTVEIRISDLGKFLRDPNHTAELTGTVEFASLGGESPIHDGEFNLFSVERETGTRLMSYRFRFRGPGRQVYFLAGKKEIRDDPGEVDVVEDMTCLFTTVYRGEDDSAAVYGAGILRFHLADLPQLVASIEVENATSWRQKPAAIAAFGQFAWGALRDEYLKDLDPIYRADYDNLVLAGEAENSAGERRGFFFVSGTHGIGFPWGDGEIFWDLLLAIEDGHGGYLRYAITDRVLEGLELDLVTGEYRYDGSLFDIQEGAAASFHQMRAGRDWLAPVDTRIEIAFDARAHEPAVFPFPLMRDLLRRMSARVRKAVDDWIVKADTPGIKIRPHIVTVQNGVFHLGAEVWRIVPEKTFGEAEHGEFRNVKEPTLLYHYLCSPDFEGRKARVQIRSDVLRNEKLHWSKDRLDALAGQLIRRTNAAEILVGDGRTRIRRLATASESAGRAAAFQQIGPPVIEVNNDHFPTAVFQRRIVVVDHPEAGRALALEEDMETIRLEPIDCGRKARVASIRDDNKLAALDRVLEETGFDALVDARRSASGKTAAEFRIVIKPNFMFAYNTRDPSTYTDPELVDHLARRLRARGYESLSVVEAQSTYGEYFTNRGVPEVAKYVGFDSENGYEIVDMTTDADEVVEFEPPLGAHPVSRVWREADFRISFAKNKTHAYAYYTLTLKNIYGALPLANKFKEYHCDRGIHRPAIQYLKAFPVDYGLIDGYLSADGPFGIFADTAPNPTHTVIGGADLVAVDWIGASKMGIDPMVSRYMQEAVREFGKPEIELVGDRNLYWPWLNVPPALTLLTHKGMDASYRFGNLLYLASANMDETYFKEKDRALHTRILRRLAKPLRSAFFVQTDRDPTLANRFFSWLLFRLGH